MSHFLSLLAKEPSRQFSLVDVTTGRVVARKLEAAIDSASRRKGLLGRNGLERDTALVIAPSNSIHTFFMRFSIDVAFVKKNGQVVRVSRDTRPWRIRLAFGAFAVIEAASGVLVENGLRAGHVLQLSDPQK